MSKIYFSFFYFILLFFCFIAQICFLIIKEMSRLGS